MRNFHRAFIFIVFNFALLSYCAQVETFAPLFSDDVTADSFAQTVGSKTINLSSNISWSAFHSRDWLSVTPASGTGGTAITLTASGYPGDLIRFVAPNPLGSGSGDSEDNAADFLDMEFWKGINDDLQTKSVEVIFLPGDYARAYVSAGSGGHGLAIRMNRNET